jgi:hypothetical protein
MLVKCAKAAIKSWFPFVESVGVNKLQREKHYSEFKIIVCEILNDIPAFCSFAGEKAEKRLFP